MKSVRNFFVERMNSSDPASSSSLSTGASTKHQLEKLKSPAGDKTIDGPHTAPPFLLSSSVISDNNGHPSTPSLVTIPSDAAITSIFPETGHHPLCSTKSESLAMTVATEHQSEGCDNVIAESHEMNLPPLVSKTQKSRRKISLPWFRQTSVSTSHAVLSRQHTIDSPGSFRLFRQTSSNFKVGALEATWVVSDYIATPGSNELSVTKGQQVEVIEIAPAADPDFCFVRLNPQNNDDPVHEGLVPVSILKPPPSLQKGNSTRKENDSIQEQNNARSKPDPLTSSTKRRGFSGRKWLPQPLRKLSQGKVDKPPIEKTLIKKSSEKNLKLSTKHAEHEDEVTTPATAGSITPTSTPQYMSQVNSAQQQDYEAEEEVGLELPPPMKPIQEPCVISNGPPAFKDMKENPVNLASTFKKMEGNAAADLSEIEQIVKEKTEQHEVKSKFLKPLDINTAESNGRDLDLSYSNSDNPADNNDENNSEANDVEAAQRKRICALQELLSTEELYIQDLAEIVNGYIAEIRNTKSEIPLPDDLKGGKERMVFGNIEAIYEWHRDNFLKALQHCINNPSELGTMIKRYERKFHMYIVYCQNKPVSEHIVSEHLIYFDQIRQKLKHRLDLSDLLIKPVQRITKYELLLREITKQTERASLVEEVPSMKEAFYVMKVICRAVNDMMVVRRLQKFEGKITAQGKLLLHGPLTCVEETKNVERNATMVQKPRELQVFLFEQSIIFADIVGKKTQFTSPSYVYRSHIQVNKMQLEELPNNRFLLKSTDPHRPDLNNYICNAATVDQNHEWLETIRKILQSQHDFLKAIQSPIAYQKELTKDS